MKLLGWIAGGLLLAAGGALAWRIAEEREGRGVEVAELGPVRGAPLRREPGRAAQAPAREAEEPARSATASATPPLEDEYADLLPPGEAQKYRWLDFEELTDFDYPGLVKRGGADSLPELPAEVRALDRRLVALEGFMNPLAFDARGVSEFTLVADPTFCCFGITPQLNHFVHVRMQDGGRSDYHSMVPIAVYGELAVGPDVEDGIVLSLYRMEARYVLSVY